MKTTETKDVAAATVFLRGADKWNARGRKAIAKWLRQQADYVEAKDTAEALGPTFRARYMVQGS